MTKTGILSLILTVLLNSSLPGQTRPETSAGVFPVDLERYLSSGFAYSKEGD